MDSYEDRPNIIYRSREKDFIVHPSGMYGRRGSTPLISSVNTETELLPHAIPSGFSTAKRYSLTPISTWDDINTTVEHPITSEDSPTVVMRHKHESQIAALKRRESRRNIVSSPLIGLQNDEEKFAELTESPDYRESGLKKLKSKSWESIARWEKENEFLFALIEDEADWLVKLFPEESVTPDTFFNDIEDGVLLCKLARLCQNYSESYAKENNKHVPMFPFCIHPRQKCQGRLGQFLRRENVELFLKWCRLHKIPEPLLFESNDVVERTEKEGLRENAREIVLVLMEVARLGVKFGLEPAPKLIMLEKEIELEEKLDSSMDGSISPTSVDSGVDTTDSFPYHNSLDLNNNKDGIDSDQIYGGDSSFQDNYCHNEEKEDLHLDGNKTCEGEGNVDNKEYSMGEDRDSESQYKGDNDDCSTDNSKVNNNNSKSSKVKRKRSIVRKQNGSTRNQASTRNFPKTELHQKVASIIEAYNIEKITRLKEGKYIILGKVMFVRKFETPYGVSTGYSLRQFHKIFATIKAQMEILHAKSKVSIGQKVALV